MSEARLTVAPQTKDIVIKVYSNKRDKDISKYLMPIPLVPIIEIPVTIPDDISAISIGISEVPDK